jgi:hypothetical protein
MNLMDSIFKGTGVRKGGQMPFTYRPQSHFSSWLARVQGKEVVSIPDHIIETVKNHMKTYRISTKDATVQLVRDILKKQRDAEFSKYYPNSVTILRCISPEFNESCPQLKKEDEMQLSKMFADGLSAFRRLRDRDETLGRKNMPSYTFMLHRLLTMLDLENGDDFKKYTICLLRHEEKIVSLEILFSKIAQEAGWT